MMTVLGKRKAPEPSISQEDASEIFRRHFESRFAPIEADQPPPAADDGDDGDDEVVDNDSGSSDGEAGQRRPRHDAKSDGEDESEWGGLSDDEISDDEADAPTVEVVDYSSSQTPKANTMSKRELKAFMSSRPPDQSLRSQLQSAQPSTTSSSSDPLPEDAPSLLAQDLELRRLLAESHLLSRNTRPLTSLSANAVEPKAFAAGRTRQRATDMRIQALGSALSIHKQEKMPMKMRKGMVAAADTREAKRRREARENGVILERDTSGKGKSRRRDRGRDLAVDRPGMGTFKGAELRLSEHDVKRIEGGRDTFGRRSKR
ncbi:pre-rRNA processing and 40S ribosomal subunit assembly [Purpureocillium takamizusanense]|uniref:Pre-rRNA processing and 40S ribosomal subunit assembly n=1 Tax=Purpureocillium takamizusanense TaxID=2060973 RepID=A0A9Q8V7A1_9HYPO|nr:pre-rRNA processing and 40S ribosomal subunit assembly [Purpureocillium takamizusanense]UNI14211.1 pre-rRNA processing and 40S ribosomal subunit assembly [Purpureocillium takamizusanense]